MCNNGNSMDDPHDAGVLRALVDSLPALLGYWDVNLRCRFANRAYETWFGVDSETMVGRDMQEFLGPLFELNRPYIAGALSGGLQSFEREIPDPQGGPPRHSAALYVPDVVDGVVRGFSVLVTDVTRRKRSEDEVRRMELGLLVEAAPTAMLAIDGARQISIANRRAHELLELDQGALVGQTVDVVFPAGVDLEACAAGCELQARAGDRDLLVEATATRSLTVPLTLVSIVDATSRKRGEAARQQMTALVESAQDAIIIKDLDGNILSWNPSATKLLGYRADEIIGRSVMMFIPFERRAEESRILEQISRGEHIENFETVRRRRDGTLVPVSLTISPIRLHDGRIIGASKIMRDLTERDLAEARFRTLFEVAPAALVMVDEHDTIVLGNLKLEQLFGYRRDELLGKPIAMLVPGWFAAHREPRVEAHDSAPATDQVGRHKLGSTMPIEMVVGPLRTQAGDFMLASVIDVCERQRIDRELRRSNAELEQFAYVASHDLQEPLRMVASYTELLGKRYKDKLDDKANRYIRYAVEGSKRMQQLVADLLEYSRVGSQGKPLVTVATGPVLATVVRILGARIRDASATIHLGTLPEVEADEGQLVQLFQNLIGNALKFRGTSPPRIRIEAALRADRWMFSVADNGIGIDVQHAEQVFQMFQRLHERGKYDGSGIGLAIAKRIVERHDGQIWLESEVGMGTTLFFTLRAARGAA